MPQFERSRIYDHDTASRLLAGDRVCAADSLRALESNVLNGRYERIVSIEDGSLQCRFETESEASPGSFGRWRYAYLVEAGKGKL